MGKFCCKLGYHVYEGIGHLSACKFCGKKEERRPSSGSFWFKDERDASGDDVE